MTTIRRYGDPAARRFAPNAATVIATVAALAFGATVLLITLTQWFQAKDATSLPGAILGLGSSTLLAVGLFVGWSVYWRPLVRAFRAMREGHPKSLVLGARIPRLDGGVESSSWPQQWGSPLAPQRAVLQIDESGISLYATSTELPSLLLQLAWDEVKGFDRIEYVESGIAYEGLAIDGSVEGSAIVLQMITPTTITRFPRGKALDRIRAQADRRRPSSQ